MGNIRLMPEKNIENTPSKDQQMLHSSDSSDESTLSENVVTGTLNNNTNSINNNSELEENPSPTNDKPGQTEDAEIVKTRVKRVGLAAIILSIGILCSRLLGFVREAVIAYHAGAGAATDAYNAAFTLPDLMNYFLAGGTMSITFIPLFATYMAKNQTEKANRLFSLIATTMSTILTIAIIICMIFTTPLAHLLFPGFNASQLADTVEMTRIVLPGQIFHYIGSLMMACLMARGQFVPSAMAPLVYNLMIIVGGVVFYPILGMKGFSLGALVGAFLGPFLIPFLALRKKVSYKPVISLTDADFKKYIFLTLPLMLGVSLTTVDEWIGRFIGSSMQEGSISWLNYARRLVLVPIAIVGQAAGQAALPYLSQLSAKGEFDKCADTLHRTLRNVILLSCIMIGFFVILAEPVVAIVYQRGSFTAQDTATTASLLRMLSVSIIFWTVQMISVRAFYAAQNTLRPMIITSIVTLVSIPVYWALSHYYGLIGLAAASVAGMCLQASSIVYFYHRNNNYFKPRLLLKYLAMGSILFAATAGGSYGGLMLANAIEPFELKSPTLIALWQLAISGGLGVLAGAILTRFMIPDTFKAFADKLLRKLHLKRSK